ncbi:DNA-binding CsgD family transcriptional regulator [Rhizobium skierniewicense]|uniref:DNA-binding CsgD family transcriptional regulator n=1 Tax=Rhizobium skierniewicense TaxID=984260 RepID=A0A7W6G137_9HYPH|nr:LuxR family transcriptional regulator [Rhizobium skierniewicense]MBB3945573.1 DNA-binding CsgD family transcriptional regulator [Rhizobium skierniewicense]NTF32613.1 LuxR family transcriptional regulator [Rhizobium skierniewicense]
MITIERQPLLSKQISAAESRPQWLQVLQTVAVEFGYTHATLMRVPKSDEILLAGVVIESTIPVRFVREFDQNVFLQYCPVLLRVADSLMPQYWSLDDDSSRACYPKPMSDLMRQFGIVNGLMIPINAFSGDRHILRFDGDRSEPDQGTFNEIGMIALHAFDVYDRMRRAEMVAPRNLTKRELEVIRWTSQGKTSAEIGQILTLSDHTINAYLNNAIRKLDCVNRTQLVAKAIRLKLIN